MMDLHYLEESIRSGNRKEIGKNRKNALKTGKKLLKTSRKYFNALKESLRLMGTLYWLTGKQKKALKWWNKSIKEAERLGARMELSRTYMEVGKCLLEPDSKYKELNGISAREYLEKARTLFKEMDMQWHLEELERIAVTPLTNRE